MEEFAATLIEIFLPPLSPYLLYVFPFFGFFWPYHWILMNDAWTNLGLVTLPFWLEDDGAKENLIEAYVVVGVPLQIVRILGVVLTSPLWITWNLLHTVPALITNIFVALIVVLLSIVPLYKTLN